MKKNIFKKGGSANWFLGLFIVLFLVVIARTVVMPNNNVVPAVQGADNAPVTVVSDKPVVLTFSDVLRRAGDIKSINIRENDATGVMKDGTKFTSVISHDPEFLTKLSDKGAVVTLDSSKSIADKVVLGLELLLQTHQRGYSYCGI